MSRRWSIFQFADVKVPNTAFKRMVRDKEFDFGELAIVTYLQAKSFGTPYCLLPATVVGRGQHHTIAYNPENGRCGRRTSTASASACAPIRSPPRPGCAASWREDYGVDLDSVKWVTFEDPHVAEYKDPPTATRAPAGKEIAKMLLDGELDAAVLGDKLPDPRLKTLIPDAEGVARAGRRERRRADQPHGGCARYDREVTPGRREGGLPAAGGKQARGELPTAGTPDDPARFGIEQIRKSLEKIIDICFEQKLIARRFTVDELFEDTRKILRTLSGHNDGSSSRARVMAVSGIA